MLNPEVKKGDRIVCIDMKDEFGVTPLTRGTVKRVGPDVFSKDNVIIYVSWDNGRDLSLLSEVDKWVLESDFERIQKKKIKESFEKEKNLMKAVGLAKYYKMAVLFKFLETLRKSGIINMFGASDYLWMGNDRINSIHKYDSNTEENEQYDELLDIADEVQSIMVRGAIKHLEDMKKNPDPGNINRQMQKDASQILITWMSSK